MTTHTPGPWYEKMQSSGQGLIASEATGQTVAIAYAGDADARLIAAAPEMRALLLHFVALGDASIRSDVRSVLRRDENAMLDKILDETRALLARIGG